MSHEENFTEQHEAMRNGRAAEMQQRSQASIAANEQLRSEGLDPNSGRGSLEKWQRFGMLPKHSMHYKKISESLENELRQQCFEVHGEISVSMDATIQTASRWEMSYRLCMKWLRKESNEMSAAQKSKLMVEATKCSESRDRAIRALKLDVPQKETKQSFVDVIDQVHGFEDE